jgi:hypothetical protein
LGVLVSSYCCSSYRAANTFKKKEDQSVVTLILLRRGDKIPMKRVTETKYEEETEGMTVQRLIHLEFHLINNHQTETLLRVPTRACCQESDIALS